jgi:hypothetical protein
MYRKNQLAIDQRKRRKERLEQLDRVQRIKSEIRILEMKSGILRDRQGNLVRLEKP